MIRTFRYPLRPTVAQAATLDSWLDLTRSLYNAALQERRDAWKSERKSITLYDQQKSLTQIRADDSLFAAMSLLPARGALSTLDLAFKSFFRRCKSGETPGYPRFRGRDRWRTLDLSNTAFSIVGNRVRVAKLGLIRFHDYRPIKGTPKTCKITKTRKGWFVLFACELPDVAKVPVARACGIDLNLANLVVTSDGASYPNPREGKKAEARLAQLQQELARKKRGSTRRAQAKDRLVGAYEYVKNCRLDAARKLAATLFGKYDLIAHEDLDIRGLIAKSASGDGMNLNRSIHDAAWGQFVRCLTLKAENAGRWAVPVDPRNTSKKCSRCGVLVPKTLRERVHRCPGCGLELDRDVNAAVNIYALGRSATGIVPAGRSL